MTGTYPKLPILVLITIIRSLETTGIPLAQPTSSFVAGGFFHGHHNSEPYHFHGFSPCVYFPHQDSPPSMTPTRGSVRKCGNLTSRIASGRVGPGQEACKFSRIAPGHRYSARPNLTREVFDPTRGPP